MRKFMMLAAVGVACLIGASSAHAQFYVRDNGYYGGYYSPFRTWESRSVDCGLVGDLPSFYAMDRNGDGRISRWEARRIGMGWAGFRELDQNGDGIIGRGEMRVYHRSCF